MSFSHAQIQQCIQYLFNPTICSFTQHIATCCQATYANIRIYIHRCYVANAKCIRTCVLWYQHVWLYACSCTLHALDETRKLQLCTETVTITDHLFSLASLPFSLPRTIPLAILSTLPLLLSLSFTLSVLVQSFWPLSSLPQRHVVYSPTTVNICWWTQVYACLFTQDCLCIYVVSSLVILQWKHTGLML